MTANPETIINALMAKRDQLLRLAEQHQESALQAATDAQSIETVIRIFSEAGAGLPPAAIRALASPADAFAAHTSRIVLTLLRDANGEPITSEDVTREVMRQNAIPENDYRMRGVFLKRAGAALSALKRRGLVKECGSREKAGGRGSFKAWTLVGP